MIQSKTRDPVVAEEPRVSGTLHWRSSKMNDIHYKRRRQRTVLLTAFVNMDLEIRVWRHLYGHRKGLSVSVDISKLKLANLDTEIDHLTSMDDVGRVVYPFRLVQHCSR